MKDNTEKAGDDHYCNGLRLADKLFLQNSTDRTAAQDFQWDFDKIGYDLSHSANLSSLVHLLWQYTWNRGNTKNDWNR